VGLDQLLRHRHAEPLLVAALLFVWWGVLIALLAYRWSRHLAQLTEGNPDEVLNNASLVYRLDSAAFQSIMDAGPLAQAERFVE
jgi:hypothetical protein